MRLLVYLLVGIMVLPPVNAFCSDCSPGEFMDYDLKVRPQIKVFLDQIISFTLISVGHTTDSLTTHLVSSKEEKSCQPPKPFPAGLYKVIFVKGTEGRALLIQTESKISHYSKIIPGKTDVGGYVQLFNNLQEKIPSGEKLNLDEIDYLLRLIYSRFCNTLNNKECEYLNKLKDMLLAILFSDKKGIDEYHQKLIQRLKQR